MDHREPTANDMVSEAAPVEDQDREGEDAAIDLEHLARYTLGNRTLQEEVLGLFRSQSKNYLKRLENARDAKAWADAAHTLKGSARSVGAMDVARHAELVEALTGDPHGGDHRDALRDLVRLVNRANRFIDRMLGNPPDDV